MKHVFIINPIAGKGDKVQQLKEQIKLYFSLHDVHVEMTTKKCEASVIAERYASTGVDMVIYACGGDGTVNEVVNGMYEYENASLAVIPIGTGNDFVKSLPFAIQELQNLKYYVQPTSKNIDLLAVDEYVGINIVTIGFDVNVAKNAEKFKKLPFKNEIIPYTMALAYSVVKEISTTYRLQYNDIDKTEKFTFIVACNGGFYGGGYKPYPQANISDGIINLVYIQNVNRFNILKLSKHYEAGTHLSFPNIATSDTCKSLRVNSDFPIDLNVDGEIIQRMNPTIKILENKVKLLLPNIEN